MDREVPAQSGTSYDVLDAAGNYDDGAGPPGWTPGSVRLRGPDPA